MSIKVETFLVDGSYMDWEEGPDFFARYTELVAQGYEGKQLIHHLVTDDWGPPPVRIRLSGSDLAGAPIDINIQYD